MRIVFVFFSLLLLFSCNEKEKNPTAQAVIDRSIEVSGTKFFKNKEVSFTFRNKEYTSIPMEKGFELQRKFIKDSVVVKEVKLKNTLNYFENSILVKLADSLKSSHANSINSVHYFSKLPYGLNDSAVQKKCWEKLY
ncbi:DUF6503 family protein [Maribacter vaceletii]|uniref:DUF6503 family protein n=1 Tax=Maribacter vaceletii TaxID=1206816 RepID=UPI000EB18999|nr:DUF6503 family protein [Maribacter vaceletii]